MLQTHASPAPPTPADIEPRQGSGSPFHAKHSLGLGTTVVRRTVGSRGWAWDIDAMDAIVHGCFPCSMTGDVWQCLATARLPFSPSSSSHSLPNLPTLHCPAASSGISVFSRKLLHRARTEVLSGVPVCQYFPPFWTCNSGIHTPLGPFQHPRGQNLITGFGLLCPTVPPLYFELPPIDQTETHQSG
jgi:hypothetical protein